MAAIIFSLASNAKTPPSCVTPADVWSRNEIAPRNGSLHTRNSCSAHVVSLDCEQQCCTGRSRVLCEVAHNIQHQVCPHLPWVHPSYPPAFTNWVSRQSSALNGQFFHECRLACVLGAKVGGATCRFIPGLVYVCTCTTIHDKTPAAIAAGSPSLLDLDMGLDL